MRVMLRLCRNSFSQLSAFRRYSKDAPPVETNQKKKIRTEKHGPITTLTIDRPHKRNCLDVDTLHELSAGLDEFERDAEARVLVLGGEGGSFSAGFDLDEVEEKGYDTLKDAVRPLLRRPLTSKPSVAAVSGFTVAEGLELALACDLRVIEDTAVLGFLGRRFGAPHSLDGGARLTSLVGLSRALDLTLTGRLVAGSVADEWGLAARLVATGTALGQALNLAMSIAKYPQSALMLDKLLAVNSQLDESSEHRTHNEGVALGLAGTVAADVKAGVDKFKKGMGRHGKSHGLTTENTKSWEHENDSTLK